MTGPGPRLVRTLLINISVFLGLSALFYFAIPVVDSINALATALHHTPDRRGGLPNYAETPWAARHFAELRQMETEYASFVGWRRRPFKGETITIDSRTRTRQAPAGSGGQAGRTVYFLGGSTIWGTGSDDAGTIPAQYQRLAGGTAWNLGESGWTAHQSLNQLIKLYAEGHRPDVVVFYDGYNDIRTKCRDGSDFWAHEREARIRQATTYRPTEPGYYAQPVLTVAQLLRRASNPQAGGCDSDPRKADLVAEQLVLDWKIAEMLVTSYGGRFHAFLQPVAYFSATRTDRIILQDSVRAQFQAVYGLIRQKVARLGWVTDLTDALDRDAYIYIDDCHVSPNGNEILATRIQSVLR